MTIKNSLVKAGNYLNGWDSEFQLNQRDTNKVERFYLKRKTLATITGIGIVIGGAGIVTLLASLGHFHTLTALLSSASISQHTMMIAGASGVAFGGTTAITHGTMVGLKKYAIHHYTSLLGNQI